MNKKQTLILIITAILGVFGFDFATISVLAYNPSFAFAALLPFMVCIGYWLDQYELLKKQRVLT